MYPISHIYSCNLKINKYVKNPLTNYFSNMFVDRIFFLWDLR